MLLMYLSINFICGEALDGTYPKRIALSLKKSNLQLVKFIEFLLYIIL